MQQTSATSNTLGDDAAVTKAADRQSRRASIALAATLPSDVVLYLLLPMYHDLFGVTLAEAGILLAANRLIRIVGYGWVARFYARRGDRLTCTIAVLSTVVCALGYMVLSGFWALLPLRLLWGLSYAGLNLSTQVVATSVPQGAAARSGRSRAFISLGPVLALPLGALAAQFVGPRPVFAALALLALCGLLACRKLPSLPHTGLSLTLRGPRRPNALDTWSFLEGFILDGLFVLGLTYMGREVLPDGAVIVAGALLALRYGAEILISPLGGRMADLWGAERLLVMMSIITAIALVGFGAGWLWSCAVAIVMLRALQVPLLPPLVARRHPGPDRVAALAARSVWRDIGAGLGPLTAGFLLPIVPAIWMYGVAALLLALAGVACGRSTPR